MRRLPRIRRDGPARRALLAGLTCGLAAVTWGAQLYVWATDTAATAPAGLSYVRTGAYATRYQAWGAGTNRPVVLVHGAFESVATWVPVATRISATAHVEAYDLEGYGYTDRVGPYTTESMALQLAGFLAARHLEHPVLVGHSLGAGVITRFVLDHPGAAAGVVFVDGDGLSATYPGSSIPGYIPEPFRTAVYRGSVRSNALVSTAFGLACGPGCPNLTPRQLTDVQRPMLLAGAEQALLALSSRPVVGGTPADLTHIRSPGLPALVVFGAEDPEFPPGAPALAAARIGAPPPTIIPRCGHLSLWSHPVPVARAIEAFLAGQAVQGSGESASMP
jgi:pimeloyl-ACP methyl ester carboxylesterase